MRQSIYIILATTLIKADIHNELRKRRKMLRAVRIENVYFSTYLMRDIGLQPGGFAIGERFPPIVKAKRTVRYLRHLYYSKIST